TRRDHLEPRHLRHRRMVSHTPMSLPPYRIKQGGTRRRNTPYLPFTLHSIVASARDNRGTRKETVDQTIREATMKTRYVVALSLLTGVAIGGAAIQGLHAQAKSKAYRVSESEVLD